MTRRAGIQLVVVENCSAGVDDLNETFLDVEASEDVAEAIVPHILSKAFLKSVKLWNSSR